MLSADCAPTGRSPGRRITPEVIDLVRRGKKTHAIKLDRELTNVDPKTAKNVIDSL